MNRRLQTSALIAVLLGLCIEVHSQTVSTLNLRGIVDQCRAVTIVDTELPVDSLRIEPALPALTQEFYLLGMASVFPTDADTTSVMIGGDVGRVIPMKILQSDSSLTIIYPTVLDSSFRLNVYQAIIPVRADTVIVDSLLTARAWDGSSGGVIFLEASRVLQLGGVIDVTGLGYAGGLRSADGGSCGIRQACDPARSARTAGKGQSPLRQDPACVSGHRPWASGGGGGDAHNAGGGGGANGGRGGRGGDQYRCSDPIGMYGVGGLRLDDTTYRRLLFGGGGGGGHQNNSVATDGSSGGGIVMLRSPRVIGDTVSIVARGRDVSTDAGNDGAGGAGAGGTVCIEACSTFCTINVDASGGRGGSAVAGHGPGGGGGGGRFLAHPALLQDVRNLRIRVTGGQAGTIVGQPANPNGASNGETGVVSAVCEDIVSHRVTMPGLVSIGDTVRIEIIARDSTSLCECLISHSLRLDGTGAAAVTRGTQLKGLAAVSTTIGVEELTYDVLIPSRSSVTIPFLCVLAPDTIISLIASARVESNLGDTLCTLTQDTARVSIDVCGHQRRQVVVKSPFSIVARIGQTRNIALDLESALPLATAVRVYDATGRMILDRPVDWIVSATQNTCTLTLDAASWPAGVYMVVAHTAHGTRSIMLRL